tara:strand:- start:449 stop:625 length:177 start_codon:yes stop_codon:yes gene_type:complete
MPQKKCRFFPYFIIDSTDAGTDFSDLNAIFDRVEAANYFYGIFEKSSPKHAGKADLAY